MVQEELGIEGVQMELLQFMRMEMKRLDAREGCGKSVSGPATILLVIPPFLFSWPLP